VVGFATAITRGPYLLSIFRAPGPPLGWRGRDAAPAASAARRANPVYRGLHRSPGPGSLCARPACDRMAQLLAAGPGRSSGCPTGPWTGVAEGQPDDPELLRWDTRVGGRHRPQDLGHLMDDCAAVPLWFRVRGSVLVMVMCKGTAMRRSGIPAATLGPLAPCAAGCPCLYLRCPPMGTRTRHGGPLRRARPPSGFGGAPGAGLQITYVETFVCSPPGPFADAACYLPAAAGLLRAGQAQTSRGASLSRRPVAGRRGAPTGRPPLHQGKPLLLQVDKLGTQGRHHGGQTSPALGQLHATHIYCRPPTILFDPPTLGSASVSSTTVGPPDSWAFVMTDRRPFHGSPAEGERQAGAPLGVHCQ